MKRTILFEGKVTLADKLVDFRIYKNEEECDSIYSYEVNPEVRDANQGGFHRGKTLRANNLEDLLFQFRSVFQKEFSNIVETRRNENF